MLFGVHMVDVGGFRLAARVEGTGPVVVFISGLGEPGDNWAEVLARFTEPVTMISYDRAGVGTSDAAPDPDTPRPYSFFADQLRRLLAALGVADPVVLVGHSFGCLIARVFTARWPEQVAGLVLVEGSVPHMALWSGDHGDRRDGDRPDSTVVDTQAGGDEVRPLQPRVPAVVMTRTPGRWNVAEATQEVDDHWRERHEELARELDAPHIVALDGGHRLNAETPGLVALAVDEVVRAASAGRRASFDPAQVQQAGGRLHP